MKNILLIIILIIISSCTKDSKAIIKNDLIGQWKETQVKNTKKTPLYNLSYDCRDNSNKAGQIYTFNIDSTYTVKDYCPNGKSETKGMWIYRDNVLSITHDSTNWKFSVSSENNNKIKFSVISAEINGRVSVDWFQIGAYMILEKQ